eukprot:3684519-Rhodomonas_salina.3
MIVRGAPAPSSACEMHVPVLCDPGPVVLGSRALLHPPPVLSPARIPRQRILSIDSLPALPLLPPPLLCLVDNTPSTPSTRRIFPSSIPLPSIARSLPRPLSSLKSTWPHSTAATKRRGAGEGGGELTNGGAGC